MRLRGVFVTVTVTLAVACGGERQPAGDTAGLTSDPSPVQGTDTPAATPVGSPGTDTGTPPSSTPNLPGQAPAMPIAGPDTAYGTVSLIGADIDSRVVVQTSAGPIAIVGDLSPVIGRLQGARVWVQGPLSIAMGRAIPPRQITVERFEVREVAGEPAVDGTLRREGDAWIVVGALGRSTSLTEPPAGLRELAGRRVWVTRAPDGAVSSFGEIR